MYLIIYNEREERIYKDMDQIASLLIQGWKIYGYTDCESLAYSLLHECQNY